jgi:uncharacterized protein (TIGR03437 family)
MTRRTVLFILACAAQAQFLAPKITPAPNGPYRVQGTQILDASGHPYLIRGTQLPPVTLPTSKDEARDFGPFSGTTFITIRQRLNMNAVRIPVNAPDYEADPQVRTRVKAIVGMANRFELVVILDADRANAAFWAHYAADFKDNPNVFFALSAVDDPQHVAEAIRFAGAMQPVIVPAIVNDPNAIYEVSPSYATLETDLRKIGSTSGPALVNGLDPQLDRLGPECLAFPDNPGGASKLVTGLLQRFDQRAISWTISAVEPGRMVDAYAGYDWTKLDDGWTCGKPSFFAGIGMTLLAHLWNADVHGVLSVNQPAGGFVIARGANASAYGRILADHEAVAKGWPLPERLSNIVIRVTDSKGVSRLAPMSWTGGGWSSTNFIIPSDAAPGPAEVAIVRSDGSVSSSGIIIADAAPGLWTATYDGRGPIIAQVLQKYANGKTAQFPAWHCEPGVYPTEGCHTVPIPLSAAASTTVRIDGAGFRYARSRGSFQAFVDGVSVPVESFGPMPNSARDEITIKLPEELKGRGEVDLYIVADGALSNVVRINIGK